MISNKLLKTFLLGSLLISASAALTTGAILSSQEKATEINAANDYNGLYDACEAAVANKSKSQLWSALKTAANSGFHNISYDNLLTAYKTTDVKESNPSEINDYYSNITHWSISGGGSCGSYKDEGDCYNREHSIPKSWWGGSPDKSSQGSDVYIVVPSDGYVNNRRSNMCMGEVSSPTYTSANSYSKIGSNTFSGHSGTVFEPNDEWKGDFARIHMYALVKWSGWSWQSGDGSAIFSGSESTNYGFTTYAKNLFKKWHDNDQPSTYEQKKNNAAQNVQGNRNPFVDHPEYADYIFFDKDFPSSDVSSISVSPSSKTLANGATQQLTVTAHYSDSTTGDVTNSATYTSTNTSVATVSSSGLVTAVASSGSATINISYSGKSTSCSITASAPTTVDLTGVTASNVSVNVGKTATIVPSPQPSNAYPIPTYTYSSNSTGVATVSSSGVVTGVSAGSATITVTATQNSIVKTTSVTATVSDAPSSASIVPTDLASSYPTSETTYTTASGIKIGAYNTANFSSKIQFKKSGGYLLNTESLSLKKLTIVGQSGTLTVCGGSAKGPTTTKTGSSGVYDLTGCSYFKIINSSGSVATCSSIEIEFGSSPAPTPTVSLNKNSTTLTIGGTETLVATTTGTGTLSWSSNNTGVASVNTSGKITAISAGTATITASYGGATATCVVTVTSSTFKNSIKECYSKSKGATVTNVYGIYVGGYNNNQSTMIMNGEYGMMLFQTAPKSGWVANETCLKVTTSTLDIYNNLYELKSCTVQVVTTQSEISQNVEPVVTYKITGSESTADLTIANRLSTLTGRVTSGTVKAGSDSTLHVNVNSHDVQLFVKKATITDEVITYFNEAGTTKDITVQGFTGFYNSNFQVQFTKVIEEEETYTAELFAQDLLNQTNEACTYSQEHSWADVKSTLSPIWVNLEGENFYAKLPAAQKAILAETIASETGTTIQIAMNRYDHIVARYELNNFISGRSVVSINNHFFNYESNDSLIIIVIIATVSVTSIGAYLFLRKRKEQ